MNDWLKLGEFFLGETMLGCLVGFHGRILKPHTFEYWPTSEGEIPKESRKDKEEEKEIKEYVEGKERSLRLVWFGMVCFCFDKCLNMEGRDGEFLAWC